MHAQWTGICKPSVIAKTGGYQCSREKSNQNVDIEKEFTVHGDFEL